MDFLRRLGAVCGVMSMVAAIVFLVEMAGRK